MQTHVKVLGWLFLISAIMFGLLALFAPAFLGFLSTVVGRSGDPDAEVGQFVLGFAGLVAGIMFTVFALLPAICGLGLLSFKPWARVMGIIMSAISLVEFPLGTIVGVYGLWVLFNKETEALFKR